MFHVGTRASLTVLREKPVGLFLDAQNLGEILLPRREMPKEWAVGAEIDVFLYRDSEDRLVATLKQPSVMPGDFGKLRCTALTEVGAFLD